MLMIGICGASGSGKSTLARELAGRLEGRCVYLKQDSYYKDHPNMTFEERERINYDEPDAFEHSALLADLQALRAGQSITTKGYDYTQHRRCDTEKRIDPADVVLLEGIHVFYDPAVRDILDFRIFIQVDPDVCLMRRVKRDIRDRGRNIESIYRQYLDSVKPMFERYIRNYVDYADLIVARGGKNARIVDILAYYINSGMIQEKAPE
ncbi:MAG: uridine kinase [Clostridia bacterium]|nr:uridine kinase [Clostridia bacterium]